MVLGFVCVDFMLMNFIALLLCGTGIRSVLPNLRPNLQMIEIRIARLSLLDTDATFKVIPVVSYLPAYNEADPINQKIL